MYSQIIRPIFTWTALFYYHNGTKCICYYSQWHFLNSCHIPSPNNIKSMLRSSAYSTINFTTDILPLITSVFISILSLDAFCFTSSTCFCSFPPPSQQFLLISPNVMVFHHLLNTIYTLEGTTYNADNSA